MIACFKIWQEYDMVQKITTQNFGHVYFFGMNNCNLFY